MAGDLLFATTTDLSGSRVLLSGVKKGIQQPVVNLTSHM
jgi:hypothetical protein